jgi:hypothetical protein
LRSNEYPIETIIDGLGFKTPHRSGDGLVYVLDMGPWVYRAVREIDTTRERAYIKKRDENLMRYYKRHGVDFPWEGPYLTSAHYRTREQYVDNLTKEQQAALTLIRMMEYGVFLEGVGGKKRSYGKIDNFVLDC